MLKLRVVQAEFGDCFVVEFGTSASPRYILVDGGTGAVYDQYLKPELEAIGGGRKKLDLVVSSHIDNDHIRGLTAFVADLRSLDAIDRFIAFDALWHNSFGRTIDRSGDINRKMSSFQSFRAESMAVATAALLGVREGNNLRRLTMALGIPINKGFSDDLVSVETSPAPISIGDLLLTVVGPTEANLRALEEEWREWLEKNEDVLTEADPTALAKVDQTVPNLSSIMLLAESDAKRLLLTGDGRGDHLVDGLRAVGLLETGAIHVEVLKIPHHGSDRNITPDFFDTVTADTYVISANGRYGNPDVDTLIWLVQAAKKRARAITIFVTNETDATRAVARDYPPREYGYTLEIMKRGATSQVITIAA